MPSALQARASRNLQANLAAQKATELWLGSQAQLRATRHRPEDGAMSATPPAERLGQGGPWPLSPIPWACLLNQDREHTPGIARQVSACSPCSLLSSSPDCSDGYYCCYCFRYCRWLKLNGIWSPVWTDAHWCNKKKKHFLSCLPCILSFSFIGLKPAEVWGLSQAHLTTFRRPAVVCHPQWQGPFWDTDSRGLGKLADGWSGEASN